MMHHAFVTDAHLNSHVHSFKHVPVCMCAMFVLCVMCACVYVCVCVMTLQVPQYLCLVGPGNRERLSQEALTLITRELLAGADTQGNNTDVPVTGVNPQVCCTQPCVPVCVERASIPLYTLCLTCVCGDVSMCVCQRALHGLEKDGRRTSVCVYVCASLQGDALGLQFYTSLSHWCGVCEARQRRQEERRHERELLGPEAVIGKEELHAIETDIR